jgi:hypothetical protein
VGIAAGAREAPGSNGLWQETANNDNNNDNNNNNIVRPITGPEGPKGGVEV